MDPVVFHPEDNIEPEAKTEGQPVANPNVSSESPTPSMPSAADPAEPTTADSPEKVLPSLEIPAGTVGKMPKSFMLKMFIKVLFITYIIATVAGMSYVRLSA